MIDETAFNAEITTRFDKMGIRLTPCKYCGEKVIFLATTTNRWDEPEKSLVIAVDLKLESHYRKCKQRKKNETT